MENRTIVDIYEGASDQEKVQFSENINSNLKVKTDFEKTSCNTEWIDLFEETIPHLDSIYRNPNRFIINEEEIVKIERARKITVESIRHLTKHTNFIQEIDPVTGDVKPSKILNINKEESYDTYENRVIYTLIQNMKYFLSVRKKSIEKVNDSGGNKNNKRIDYTGSSKVSNEKVNVTLTLDTALDSTANKTKNSKDTDNSEELLQRISDIEVKILDLTSSETYKVIDKKHIALINGAVKKTNLILKNVHFQYAMKLWAYLQDNVEDKTQNVSEKKDYEDNGELKKLIDDSFYLQYLIVDTLDKEKDEEIKDTAKEQEVQNIIISKMLEKVADMNSNLTEEQLEGMVAEKFAVIKYRNMVTMQEIQDIFSKHFDKYLAKIKY